MEIQYALFGTWIYATFFGKKTALKEHSGLTQFFTTENPLEMMKNAFYYTLKALFVLKIFKFWSWRKTA